MNNNRYIRQTSLKEFGRRAQDKLAASRVLIVGLGGLGIPVAQYLNAMGVGTLGLADQDTIELHNLQRQVLFTEKDLGRSKLGIVQDFLKRQNSSTQIIAHDTFVNPNNALTILQGYDLVVDATDNFPTRYLINDACVILNKPFVYGALHGFEGQVSVFNYGGGPTYRCLFPEMPAANEIPDCNLNGVLGVIPGIIGNFQALEAVKILSGIGDVCSGWLMLYDGLRQEVRKIKFPLVPNNRDIKVLKENYGDLACMSAPEVVMEELIRLRQKNNSLQIIDVRSVEEFNEFKIEGSVNIPLQELSSLLGVIDTNQPVYVICATGKRSGLAQQQLQRNSPGLEVYNIKGGIQKYKSLCV